MAKLHFSGSAPLGFLVILLCVLVGGGCGGSSRGTGTLKPVAGRILIEESGTPLAGAALFVQSFAQDSSLLSEALVSTDTSGSFLAEIVTEDSRSITVTLIERVETPAFNVAITEQDIAGEQVILSAQFSETRNEFVSAVVVEDGPGPSEEAPQESSPTPSQDPDEGQDNSSDEERATFYELTIEITDPALVSVVLTSPGGRCGAIECRFSIAENERVSLAVDGSSPSVSWSWNPADCGTGFRMRRDRKCVLTPR